LSTPFPYTTLFPSPITRSVLIKRLHVGLLRHKHPPPHAFLCLPSFPPSPPTSITLITIITSTSRSRDAVEDSPHRLRQPRLDFVPQSPRRIHSSFPLPQLICNNQNTAPKNHHPPQPLQPCP